MWACRCMLNKVIIIIVLYLLWHCKWSSTFVLRVIKCIAWWKLLDLKKNDKKLVLYLKCASFELYTAEYCLILTFEAKLTWLSDARMFQVTMKLLVFLVITVISIELSLVAGWWFYSSVLSSVLIFVTQMF